MDFTSIICKCILMIFVFQICVKLVCLMFMKKTEKLINTEVQFFTFLAIKTDDYRMATDMKYAEYMM